MAEMNALKDRRSKLKGQVTRSVNSIKKFKAEDDEGKVKAEYEKLKQKFDDFEIAHDEYHDKLKTAAEWEESDTYFYAVQDSYIAALESVKVWLKSRSEGPEVKPDGAKEIKPNVGNPPSSEALNIMNQPKMEIEIFEGDPAKFHIFMTTFDEVVHKVPQNDRTKLARLLSVTGGDARNAIRGCVLVDGDEGYKTARQILKDRFGDDHLVTEQLVRNLRYGGPVKSPKELQQLADDLRCCHMTLSQMNHLQEMESQLCIVEIVSRLQPYLQNRWKKQALDAKNESKKYPGFKTLVDFVNREANDANDPVYGKMGQRGRYSDEKCKKDASSSKLSTSFSSNVNESGSKWKRPPCMLCGNDHRLLYCSSFKEMKPHDRLRYVHERKLCENCLLNNHVTEKCRKPSVCDVSGCGKKHTRYIHVEQTAQEKKASGDRKGNHVSANNISVNAEIHMPIVEVKVNDSFNVCALLDTASSSSFCSRSLAENLGVESKSVKYFLNTLGKSEERWSDVVDFKISSKDGSEVLNLSHVYVVDSIPVRSAPVNCESYDHLKALSMTRNTDAVEILIGQDNAEALVPLEVRRGRRHEPFAVRTMFGWSLNGPAKVLHSVKQSVISHFIHADSLEQKVDSLWNIENEGVSSEASTWSQNDKKVIQLWDDTCKQVDGHYELPIPWKSTVNLPNNVSVAWSRLKSLELSLDKRGLRSCYDREMKLLLSKGYAEPVPPSEIVTDRKVWYLPHQVVVSDKKPGKIRIVFDCAAKFQGVSLNSNCLQGPDLINRLLNVMLRFRQHPYAIMADVEGMYHQVLVPVEDRDALRFLWFSDSGQISHFRMTRHLFGGIWCSSSSTYALRRILVDNPQTDPVVVDTIMRSFYVDDCLKSVSSRKEAEVVIHGTKSVLSEAGFNLTKFVTNDSQLLDEIPESDRAKEVKDFSPECKSKALGVKWCVSSDVLYFDVAVGLDSVVTRRVMLSFVASIFDPLGLVSPVVITGKLLFQEATRLKLSWDSEVPDDLRLKWEAWLRVLKMLNDFKVPRCIKPLEFEDAFLELHHFSDASSKAYGCCSYLRCVDKNGRICVSLVLSKCKVAPLKQITIPRLELQAAVLAARVDSTLRNELDLQLGPSYFWSDSEIVLKYIKNDEKKFQVFVGNRVSVIRELTSPDQWHHIAGKDNPADRVSRGQEVQNFDADSWVSGPVFLRKYKSEWNVVVVSDHLSENDPEIKSEQKQSSEACFLNDVDSDPIEKLFERYSSWYNLKRAVAWILRLKRFLQSKKVCDDSRKSLSVDDLAEAELVILRYVQSKSFPQELKSLSAGKPVGKGSAVRCLDPFVDSEGLIRVGGRVRGADLVPSQVHPILVPHDHPVAVLIVHECHDYAHVGTEWVVSEVRKKFWITKIRRVVKRVSRSCFKCRKYFGSPCVQKMANLPPERLEAGRPPFYYVGIDCFGPFLIKQGRSEIKRYGCVFTCLNTRAVHLEKLHNLDVDSFLSGFRRFVSRRGTPSKVWTDNGTNFVGGQAEMSRCFDELQTKMIELHGVRQNVAWHFNPPSASHMGGIWERMIRTIRKVLVGIAGLNVRLTDESLCTLFCEVEQMVNSRPITKASNDVNDSCALTPNHLLLLREQPSLSPGMFHDADLYKRRWRCVQHLADVFWSKWLSEYLPELQKRAKWFKSHKNVKVGDLVLITNENTPRGVWPMGIVQEVYPGTDGLVRSVKIKTKVTELVRPIVKIVLLEGSQ